MSWTIGRLAIEDPESFPESVGESTSRVGATPVPGGRQGLSTSAGLVSFTPVTTDTVADRQQVRRQLRALLNNLPMRLTGVYVAWSEDDEQNGWYVPGKATFDVAGEAALVSAFWRFTGLELALVGRPRTHLRGVQAYLRDRRLSTTPRDTLKRVYSADFASLTALGLTWLPSAVTDPVMNGDPAVALTGQRAGQGGSLVRATTDAVDLAVISFEQVEADRNLGDVVVYDRRGTITTPSSGPDAAWEEVYGPDWPLSQPNTDVPTLDNSFCRVSYVSANSPGFRLDRWTGAAWVEQGKILIETMSGATPTPVDTLVSASVVEWSPERAVIRAIMRLSSVVGDREEVYITLQRGWTGPRFEMYPPGANDAGVTFYLAGAPSTNDSAVRVGSTAGQIVATAGTGSVNFTDATAVGGTGSFDNENWASLVRQGGAAQVNMAVVQGQALAHVRSTTSAFGSLRNGLRVRRILDGYISAHLGFATQATDQTMEAEAMTLAAGTASTADGAASGGTAATATRTAEADHVTRATWPNGVLASYRIFARVRTSAGATLSIRAQIGAVVGTVKTTTSTSYVWIDLGEFDGTNATLQIRAWIASGTLFVDRIEAHMTGHRTAASPLYTGARDLGSEILFDSRSPQVIVSR